MVTKVFNQSCLIFRPTTPKDTSARTTYTSFTLSNIKLDALCNATTGQKQGYRGTLFYNIDISSTTGTETPLLKAGDFVTTDLTVSAVPDTRMAIASVKECYRNGVLHHYECELI